MAHPRLRVSIAKDHAHERAIDLQPAVVLDKSELPKLVNEKVYPRASHRYGPGTRHHIKNAMKAGATLQEIIAARKLCVVQGAQACNLGVTILAEELERDAAEIG